MQCVWGTSAQCLKIFKAVQYTNPMVNLTFDQHGLNIMSMDGSKTSLVRLRLQPDFFTSYSCSTSVIIGVYTEMVVNILSKAKKSSVVWNATDDVLSITFVNNDQKTIFSLRGIDIEEDHLDIPELEDDCAIQVRDAVLREWMDKVLMTKGDVSFQLTENTFVCKSNSIDMGTIQHTEPIGGDRVEKKAHRNDVDITLSYHSTKSMAVFSGCGDTCFVGFSNEQPSRLKVPLGTGSYLCVYVAPKIVD